MNANPINREILRYLTAHPDARDTARGIREWWIPYDTTDDEVRDAIEWLIERNWLTVLHPVGCYGLNRNARAEIERWLDEGESNDVRG